MTLKTSDPSD